MATIQLAEGQREAQIRVAEGKAKSIKIINEAAEQYFKGNAQEFKRLEVTENSLKNNSKIILSEGGISPTILIGELPLSESHEIYDQSLPSTNKEQLEKVGLPSTPSRMRQLQGDQAVL